MHENLISGMLEKYFSMKCANIKFLCEITSKRQLTRNREKKLYAGEIVQRQRKKTTTKLGVYQF